MITRGLGSYPVLIPMGLGWFPAVNRRVLRMMEASLFCARFIDEEFCPDAV